MNTRPNETTPLLSDSDDSRSTKPSRSKPGKLQLTILFLILFCEAISSIVIYPFVNQLVRSTGIAGGDEKRVGYFSGIIESLFFLAEGATVMFWQLASEKFGRRPILLLAPLGLGVSMISFGLADSFWGLVVTRTFQGVFNGDVGVTKTVLAELSDSSNRAEIMAMGQVLIHFGITLAPMIGGGFSEPEEIWPNTFGKIQLLRDRPYLLPCIVCGIISLVCFVLAAVALEETHHAFVKKERPDTILASQTIDEQFAPQGSMHPTPPQLPTISTILTRDVVLVLTVGGIYAACIQALRALQALIWSTSIKNGGLGLSALVIGAINTSVGFPSAALQILFLGKLVSSFGSRNGIIASFCITLIALLIYPVQIYFAKEAGEVDWIVGVFIFLGLGLWLNVRSWGSAAVLVSAVEVSPTPASVGVIQGVLQMTSVLMRGIAPTVALSLFAFSVGNDVLEGNFVYLVLGVINIGAMLLALRLPKS
ncbi:major facilitator superfamily domain-containing protein [Flagelloscypha sp. PMI_526]|nr:major facilitator superfamily domain-containing protein [Flagelloscypha sp. PMI_526]